MFIVVVVIDDDDDDVVDVDTVVDVVFVADDDDDVNMDIDARGDLGDGGLSFTKTNWHWIKSKFVQYSKVNCKLREALIVISSIASKCVEGVPIIKQDNE